MTASPYGTPECRSRSLGFGGTTSVQARGPQWHAQAGLQSCQGKQVGIGLASKRSHKGFSTDGTSTRSLVHGEALPVDGASEFCCDPTRVLSGDRSFNLALWPLTGVQVVNGPLDRIDSSRHLPSVLAYSQLRAYVCQVSNGSSKIPGPGITGMWFT